MKGNLKDQHLKSADKILSKKSLDSFESKISELKEYYQIKNSKSFE